MSLVLSWNELLSEATLVILSARSFTGSGTYIDLDFSIFTAFALPVD